MINTRLTDFFSALNTFLITQVFPISNELDHDTNLLKETYQQLIALGSLNLLIPNAYAGLAGDRQEWIHYNIQLAQYSGALLFLQAQHQSAIAHLKKMLPNDTIISIFQNVTQANMGLGIALAANRHLLKVQATTSSFMLSGVLPWVSGWEYFSHLLLSFDVDKTTYYVLLPFKTCETITSNLTISPPLSTVVFSAASTVSVTLKNWRISRQDIIATRSHESSKPVEHPSIYNFAGIAKAFLNLAMAGKYATQQQVMTLHQFLLQKWQLYYEKIMQQKSCPYRLRAEGRRLAEQCASFARMVCGSVALLADHPLDRLSRELWQYTIAGDAQQQLPYYLEYFEELSNHSTC